MSSYDGEEEEVFTRKPVSSSRQQEVMPTNVPDDPSMSPSVALPHQGRSQESPELNLALCLRSVLPPGEGLAEAFKEGLEALLLKARVGRRR